MVRDSKSFDEDEKEVEISIEIPSYYMIIGISIVYIIMIALSLTDINSPYFLPIVSINIIGIACFFWGIFKNSVFFHFIHYFCMPITPISLSMMSGHLWNSGVVSDLYLFHYIVLAVLLLLSVVEVRRLRKPSDKQVDEVVKSNHLGYDFKPLTLSPWRKNGGLLVRGIFLQALFIFTYSSCVVYYLGDHKDYGGNSIYQDAQFISAIFLYGSFACRPVLVNLIVYFIIKINHRNL